MNTLFPALLKPYQKPAFTLVGEVGEPKPLSVEPELTCINCKSTQERWTADDFTSCMNCGEVQERSIDSGAEYRFFGAEDRGMVDPCRVGAPTDTRFPTSTLGTMILPHAHGGNSTTRVAMARVRRFHSWNLLP